MHLDRRAIPIPIQLGGGPLRRAVYDVVEALERGDAARAARLTGEYEEAFKAQLEGASDAAAAAQARRHAVALMSVLVDLVSCGWEIAREGVQVYLLAPRYDARAPDDVLAEKARVRGQLRPRVEEQLRGARRRALIARMESPHPRTGRTILDLIADGPALAAALEARGAEAIQPYLQRARTEDGEDQRTGLKLHDCFTYLHLRWSFPTEQAPGRRIPFLVRDAGQPGDPICGLLLIASPVAELASRDASLGWTTAWLEAVIAGLDVEISGRGELRAALARLGEELDAGRARDARVPSPSWLARDLAALLSLPAPRSLDDLARALAALGEEAKARRDAALARLAAQLVGYVTGGLAALSFEGLGCSPEDAPEAALQLLTAREEEAARAWRRSTRAGDAAAPKGALDLEALFTKKRAARAAALLRARVGLQGLQEASARGDAAAIRAALRGLSSRRAGRWGADAALSLGADVTPALRQALTQHKIALLSSRVVDVSVCGALEPYRALLGGKLVALLALSQEVAGAYHEAYARKPSQIESQMAARAVVRPATLCAMITTGFYARGSAQYNRLALPDALGGARWLRAGDSEGSGTLHFSAKTSARLCEVAGHQRQEEVTGAFGEGPSERLRKLRAGLSALGLPTEALIRHGMRRAVYTARLSSECLLGAVEAPRPYHERAPSAAQVAARWRERWLTPRLRDPAYISSLRTFQRSDTLLSHLLRRPRRADERREHTPRGLDPDELRATHQPLLR